VEGEPTSAERELRSVEGDLRRLRATAEPTVPAEAYAGLELAARAPASRPYTIANMVCALDGRATIAGRSGGLSSKADQAVFAALRSQVDAILVGTGTLGAERYGAPARTPEARASRRAAGLAERPLVVTISRSLNLPLDIPLFADPATRIVVYTASEREPEPSAAQVEVIKQPHVLSGPAAALADLRRDRGVRSILCEGGPRLLGALVAADLLDELFLTLSPTLVGGSGVTMLDAGELDPPPALELESAFEGDGDLFLRYSVCR
jgi:riboflavin-specific deaminase-like protein